MTQNEPTAKHPSRYDYLAVACLGLAGLVFWWSWINHNVMGSLAALVFILAAIGALYCGRLLHDGHHNHETKESGARPSLGR
jgi:hypothetical protein